MALPTTDLEIVNLALDNLCHTVPVVNLATDNTPEAKAARRWLDIARDRALGMFWWPWAEGYAELALASQTHKRWAHCYTAPADMVPNTGRFQSAEDPNPLPQNQIPFDELNVGGVRVIGCNLSPSSSGGLPFYYTRRETSVAVYPQEFVEFFAWLLAACLAKPVTKDVTGKTRLLCLQEANAALAEAKVAALTGKKDPRPPTTPSVAARSGNASSGSSGDSAGDWLDDMTLY